MIEVILTLGALAVAYTNGANDNFKGVATLFGSKTLTYDRALGWATLTTAAGALVSVVFSAQLVAAFSGQGLVPVALTRDPAFLGAVGLGAALTVGLATVTGFPISTTHALTGGLAGAGLAAAGAELNFARLGTSFVLPLAASPFLAGALTTGLYPLMTRLKGKLGVTHETCLCVGREEMPVAVSPGGEAVLRSTGMKLTVDQMEACRTRYQGRVAGVSAQALLNVSHYVSAGAVCFARGLNDTPKIVALLAAARLFSVSSGAWLVALGMVAGGWLQARKVAQTMSFDITTMNDGQGFTANAVTALLVLIGSRLGLPFSTTHVSCGSLFGLGAVNGQAKWKAISHILLAWVATLPLAALSAAVIYAVVSWSNGR